MRKFILIAAAILVVYAAVGFVLAPFLARHFGEKALRERTGPGAAIEAVRMNPFTLTATVEGVRVPDAGSGISGEVARVFVDVEARSLWAWHPVLETVRVEGPRLSFHRRAREKPSAKASEPEGPGWREAVEGLASAGLPELEVGSLEVAEGAFTFRDTATEPAFAQTVRPIRFTLTDFTTVAEAEGANTFVFRARTPAGARFRLEGGIDVSDFGVAGTVGLTGVAVEQFAPYYAEASPAELERAVFDLSFAFAINATAADDFLRVTDGALGVRDVAVRAPEPDAPLLSLDAATVEGAGFTFPEMRLSVGAVTLSGGATHIRRGADGRLQLMSLMPENGGKTDSSREKSGGDGALRYGVETLRVEDHRIRWEDAAVASGVRLAADVEKLSVTDVSSDDGKRATVSGEVRIGKTGTDAAGRLTLDGGFRPNGTEAQLDVVLESLPLAMAAPYASAYGGVGVASGTLAFDGRVVAGADAPLRVTGSGALSDVSGDIRGDGVAGEWKRLGVEALALEAAPFNLLIETVRLEGPSLRVTRRDAGRDAMSAGAEGADASAAVAENGETSGSESGPGKPAGGGVPVEVGTFALTGGRLNFTDQTVSPASTLGAEDLELTVSDIAPGRRVRSEIAVSGNVAGSAVRAEGAVSLDDPERDTRLDFSMNAFPLPRLSPYAGAVLGRRIANGALSVDGEWRLKDRRLEAANRIRIKQLAFGESVAGESAVNLPLGLAVTLLTGPDDTIAVSLPLSGDLGGPKAGIGPIVRTALFGLVRETVSAPFNLLSGLVKTEKDLSRIAFATDKARLDTEATERLNTLADALKERPEVRLRLVPVLSEADVAALARVELMAKLLRQAPDPATAEVEDLLLEAYARKTGTSGETLAELDPSKPEDRATITEALLPDVTVAESEKAALGRKRMAAVRAHLTQARGIAPERIQAADFATDADFGGVRFELF